MRELFIDGPNIDEYQYLIRFNCVSLAEYHVRRLMEERLTDRTVQPSELSYWLMILPATLIAGYYLMLPPVKNEKPWQCERVAD